MVLPKPPRDTNVAVVPLDAGDHPYGAGCALDRDVQAVAHHYSLSKENVQELVKMELIDLNSYALCDPDGGLDEKGTFRLTIAYFDSPIVRAKVTRFIRRLCTEDVFAPVPVDVSGEGSSSHYVIDAPKKKGKKKKDETVSATTGVSASVSVSGVGDAAGAVDAAVGGDNAVSKSSKDAAAAAPSAAADAKQSKSVSDQDSSDSGDSESSSDADDVVARDDATEPKAKKSKTSDKAPRDPNAMVAQIGDAVSLLVGHVCPLLYGKFSFQQRCDHI